ncbi:MAG: PIG-L family deacetylase [Archangiaceae bacterium]|nr:PIG-L family deacetylase [Archangiaceae bacterium]
MADQRPASRAAVDRPAAAKTASAAAPAADPDFAPADSRTLLEIAEQVAPPRSWSAVVAVGLDRHPVAYLDAGAQVTAVLPEGQSLASAKAEQPRYHHLEQLTEGTSLAQQGVPKGRANVLVVSDVARPQLDSLAETLAPGGTLVMAAEVPEAALRGVGLTPLPTAPGHVTVARKPGSVDPQKVFEGLDRTTCVDRERVARLAERPLMQGPLHTLAVPDSDPTLRAQLDAMRAAVATVLERGDELEASTIPLPDRTAASAMRGQPRVQTVAVFAHPDDETVYTGGTVAALSRRGVPVVVVAGTDGGAGRDASGKQRDLAALRAGELAHARRVLGVERTVVLGLDDFGKYRDSHRSEPVTAGDALRLWGLDATLERLVRAIRTERPDTLLAFDPERDPNYSLHGHHQAMGVATLLAYHLAADPQAFPEQLAEGLEAWAPRRHLVVVPPHAKGGTQLTVGIDADAKVAALKAHASQSYSTERLLKELAADPGGAVEHWNLLQARVGNDAGPLETERVR